MCLAVRREGTVLSVHHCSDVFPHPHITSCLIWFLIEFILPCDLTLVQRNNHHKDHILLKLFMPCSSVLTAQRVNAVHNFVRSGSDVDVDVIPVHIWCQTQRQARERKGECRYFNIALTVKGEGVRWRLRGIVLHLPLGDRSLPPPGFRTHRLAGSAAASGNVEWF